MNCRFYDLTPEEIEKVKEVNLEPKKFECSCMINEAKPSHCKQGPLPTTRLPECGYYFEKDENGKTVRKGECKRCGRCCCLPRRSGSPYGLYDPNGSKCIHLVVKEI